MPSIHDKPPPKGAIKFQLKVDTGRLEFDASVFVSSTQLEAYDGNEREAVRNRCVELVDAMLDRLVEHGFIQ